MACVWRVCGVCVACVWRVCGVFVACVWRVCGVCMVRVLRARMGFWGSCARPRLGVFVFFVRVGHNFSVNGRRMRSHPGNMFAARPRMSGYPKPCKMMGMCVCAVSRAHVRVLGGGCGPAAGQLKCPYGVRLSADGTHVVVADSGNDRVTR